MDPMLKSLWCLQGGSHAGAFSLSSLLVDIPDELISDPRVKWSLQMSRYARESNPHRFFRMCEDATYVQTCFLHLKLLEVCHVVASSCFEIVKTC